MSRARRPSAFKSLQYFLNRSQVLAQYHEFLRITQPLEDAVRRDVRAQIRSAFEMYRDVEDETKAAQLVRQGRDQLKHVSDLVDSSVARQRLATQQAEQSDTWLDSQAPTDTVDSDGEADVRGRIGQGWPWSKNKTVQKIELEGIRRLAKGRDTISAMESSNPDMPVPKPVKFVQDDEGFSGSAAARAFRRVGGERDRPGSGPSRLAMLDEEEEKESDRTDPAGRTPRSKSGEDDGFYSVSGGDSTSSGSLKTPRHVGRGRSSKPKQPPEPDPDVATGAANSSRLRGMTLGPHRVGNSHADALERPVVASGPTADVIGHFHKDCWLQQFDVCRVSDPSSPRMNLYAVHLDDLTTVQKVALPSGFKRIQPKHTKRYQLHQLGRPRGKRNGRQWTRGLCAQQPPQSSASRPVSAPPVVPVWSPAAPPAPTFTPVNTYQGPRIAAPGVLPAQPTVCPQAPEPLSPGFDEPMTSDPGRGTPSPVQMAQPAGRATVMTGSTGLPMQTSAYMCPVRPFILHRALELFDDKGSIYERRAWWKEFKYLGHSGAWTDAEKCHNLEMYLRGVAESWSQQLSELRRS
ncbi:hypothetical protein ATCC90586_002668 [Pythium insidiosum]|nr:hypothetical protein ATCC90586_002668 [Pythium insidiosum]